MPDPQGPADARGKPAAERKIDAALVRALLREQHPDLADLPLRPVESGWDNVMLRLGDALAVRLPRREFAVPLLRNEQAWLPQLAAGLPLPIPAPLRMGRPSARYPFPWSVLPWLPGQPADLAPPGADQARPLAEFLRALHRPAPAGAPSNPWRGVPLAERAESLEPRLERLAAATDLVTPEITRAWREALRAPSIDRRDWLHGDLHPRNVLVEAGTITGVIDWGDLTSGDPATDLAGVWMLLEDADARADCLRRYGADAALRTRAVGWAVFFGSVLLDSAGVDDPRHAATGEATLRRLAEDLR